MTENPVRECRTRNEKEKQIYKVIVRMETFNYVRFNI